LAGIAIGLGHSSVDDVLNEPVGVPRGAKQVAQELIGENLFGPAPGLAAVAVGDEDAPFDAARVYVKWCVVSHIVVAAGATRRRPSPWKRKKARSQEANGRNGRWVLWVFLRLDKLKEIC
jgi:hypothetical protein